jgi:hypothetical protein
MDQAKSSWNRREFIKAAGSVAALAGAEARAKATQGSVRGVSLVVDPDDSVARTLPSMWAVDELERSLTAQGVKVNRCEKVAQANIFDLCIVAAGFASPMAMQILKDSHVQIESVP